MGQFMPPLTWEWLPIFGVAICLSLVKSSQGFAGNIIGSFIIAVMAYLIVKIPVLIALGGIPNPNPQHHLIAAIVSTLICGGLAIFAVLRSRNASLPPLHKLLKK